MYDESTTAARSIASMLSERYTKAVVSEFRPDPVDSRWRLRLRRCNSWALSPLTAWQHGREPPSVLEILECRIQLTSADHREEKRLIGDCEEKVPGRATTAFPGDRCQVRRRSLARRKSAVACEWSRERSETREKLTEHLTNYLRSEDRPSKGGYSQEKSRIEAVQRGEEGPSRDFASVQSVLD